MGLTGGSVNSSVLSAPLSVSLTFAFFLASRRIFQTGSSQKNQLSLTEDKCISRGNTLLLHNPVGSDRQCLLS